MSGADAMVASARALLAEARDLLASAHALDSEHKTAPDLARDHVDEALDVLDFVPPESDVSAEVKP